MSVTLIGFDHLDRSLCLTLWLYCMPSFLRGYIVRSISIVSKGLGGCAVGRFLSWSLVYPGYVEVIMLIVESFIETSENERHLPPL